MAFFEDILRLFKSEMTQPQPYGLFHLTWFAFSILAGILLCITHKKGDGKRVRRAVLITAIIVTLLEIYKQITFSFNIGDEGITFSYPWYAFPWQFCSTPLYVGLIAGFTKKGLIHRMANAYLATYALFAGAAVMFIPTDVFTIYTGINIQTMVCHGSMITIAIYLLGSGYVQANWRSLLRAMTVFSFTVGIAMILNEVAYQTGLTENHYFNMFYISPHCDPHLPIYGDIQRALPYPAELAVYTAGFSGAAGIILLATHGLKKLSHRKVKTAA